VIVANILTKTESSFQAWQYPLYRASPKKWVPYNVSKTLPENGEIFYEKVSLSQAVKFTFLLTIYRSQFKSMLGLAPFFIMRWILLRKMPFQTVLPSRLNERPHEGPLLYEKFGRLEYSEFHMKASQI